MQKFYFLAAFLLLNYVAVAQDFRFGKVSVEEVQQEAHPLDAEADAAVLYKKQNVSFDYNEHTGFTLVTDIHERIKIYTKEGFDWATKAVYQYQNSNDRENVSSINGTTYNLHNGKLTEEKLKKNGIFEEEESAHRRATKFTLPAVKEGSVIEYKYTIRSPFVTSIDDTPLQYTIPLNHLEAKITIPEFLGFKKYFNTRSPISVPVEETKTNFSHRSANGSSFEYLQNVYSVTANNIPALKDEDYVDYLHNYAAFLKWELMYTKFPNSTVENYSLNWEGVAKNIFNDLGFQKELNRDGFFKGDVDKLLEGVVDTNEKINAVYGFIKQKVKWNGNYGFTVENGGRSAFKKGEGNVGDLNLLLTAMLRYAGFNANPVVVSTKSNGIPIFPTRNGFNYVIAAVELPDRILLLDATDPQAAVGELPSRARNWQGRIIREDGTSAWVNLIPTYFSQERVTLNYELGDDMVMRGKSRNLQNGLFAKAYRERFADIKQETVLDYFLKNKGNITIADINQENIENIGADINETYSFELQHGVDVIADRIYLKPFLYNTLKENPFKADERNYPVFFEYPMVKNHTVNILIPEGYEVESLPESAIFQINGGEGEFKFVANQNGRFLRIESNFSLKNIVFIPTSYSALKEFYAQMVDKQSEAIVLKKT